MFPPEADLSPEDEMIEYLIRRAKDFNFNSSFSKEKLEFYIRFD